MDACNITKKSVAHSLDFMQVEEREYEWYIISCLSSFLGRCIAQQMEKLHQQLKICFLSSSFPQKEVSHRAVHQSRTFQGTDISLVMQMLKDSLILVQICLLLLHLSLKCTAWDIGCENWTKNDMSLWQQHQTFVPRQNKTSQRCKCNFHLSPCRFSME